MARADGQGGGSMTVEVAFARPDRQEILTVDVPFESTIEAAIHASGILERFPEIDLKENRVGVFGKLARLDTCLSPGDRVEIYRPLKADPREARRRKARQGRTMRKGD
ncbi:RnfH family protein [Natronospira bacteriovora]|uniref:UPF0125 protein RBH19_04410 n=1 Tax=Natronospira bacteriovora TaxID=3069753 RepID=A0ABU0W517_9GAMM|nr:RnfH family protein [Natronospira sp. AB-CW4]MDQ2069109.1 RnfH family protein [Natronospira sp. AB-CW4]